MDKIKAISPSVVVPLKEALANAFWYKNDLKTFLNATVKNNNIIPTLDWQQAKYKICSDLIDRMIARQDIYQQDILAIIESLCNIVDFSYLLRLENGAEKAQKAKKSIVTLRNNTQGYFELKSEKQKIKANQEKYNEQIIRTIDFDDKLTKLKNEFYELSVKTSAQERGYALERFLIDLFNLFDLGARKSFKIEGEQIDGAFTFDGTDYIIEAKWVSKLIEKKELSIFHEKIESKLKTTLGLFISINGFNESSLSSGFQNNNMILMDGRDLILVLEKRIGLTELLLQKRKHASQTGEIMFRVQC